MFDALFQSIVHGHRSFEMLNLKWEPEDDQAASYDGLTYRSNLLGTDRSVCNFGGGNTSSKLMLTDAFGRTVRVLVVKASNVIA